MLEQSGEATTDFVAIWKNTQDRINSYHSEARSQLRSSYWVMQIATICGFLVILILGIVAATAARSAIQAIVTGGVSAVAAALAAFIGSTFQSTYSQSLRQRMAYFDEPVVMARLLAGERLVTKLDESSAKTDAIQRIIQAAVSDMPIHYSPEAPSAK